MKPIAHHQAGLAGRVVRFYVGGLRNMTLGRTLWRIIFLKIVLLFCILKLFYFPDVLQKNFTSDEERADYVAEQLLAPPESARH